jgi:type VI secretion system secreted protein Hcp
MASAMFLKISSPNVEGESTDSKHSKEIELLSFSHGVGMTPGPRSTAGSATTEKSSHSDVSVVKQIDKSTPEIAKGICQGTHYGEMVISINKADGKGGMIEYMKYTLNDVLITSQHIGGADGGGLATESLSFNYGKIKWEYVPTDATNAAMGTVPFAWDVAKNAVG